MKVLITGGAGFIGGHLATALAHDGVNVDLADNMSRGIEDPFLAGLKAQANVRLFSINLQNINDTEKLDENYDIIFHLAAIIGVRHVMERPYEVLEQNAVLTSNVINLARKQNNLKRFLFASTSEVTAGTLKYMDMPVPTPENVPLVLTELNSPRTSYMLSKIYGEAMCIHSKLPFTIFRPHNVYGPRMGMVHVIPELLKKTLDAPKNSILKVASIEHRRAFCYIDDAIAQLRQIIDTHTTLNDTYNLGNQQNEISIGDLARIILKIVGRTDLAIEALPETPGSPSRRCPDMNKTINALQLNPSVDLAEGIARTYAWYKENVFISNGKSAI